MEASNRRRYQRLWGKPALVDANLPEPGLVENDFLLGVAVGDVVLGQVRECVRYVGEGITIGRCREPGCEVIVQSACKAPAVLARRAGPKVDSHTKRFLIFQSGGWWEVVVDCVVRIALRASH